LKSFLCTNYIYGALLALNFYAMYFRDAEHFTGGVSLAMAADVAETTRIERPPRGREEVPVQLSRLVDAHQIIIQQSRPLARRATELGDDGTNDLVVSYVIRTNELQVWFLSEHLVDVPLVEAKDQAMAAGKL
jgi:starvation-inducible DNA-binding protein